MAIITLEEVRLLSGFSTMDYDDQIEALIPEVESFVERFCNEDFTGDVYPSGIKRPVAEMIKYDILYRNKGIGVSSESIGEYDVTYDSVNVSGYPDKIISLLKPYRRIKFV